MKNTLKLIGEIINVFKRHSLLFISSLTAGFLTVLGLFKLVEIIINTF